VSWQQPMFLITQYIFKIIKLLLDGRTVHAAVLVGGVTFQNFIRDHHQLGNYVICHKYQNVNKSTQIRNFATYQLSQ
jgi:hypothetical protein